MRRLAQSQLRENLALKPFMISHDLVTTSTTQSPSLRILMTWSDAVVQ